MKLYNFKTQTCIFTVFPRYFHRLNFHFRRTDKPNFDSNHSLVNLFFTIWLLFAPVQSLRYFIYKFDYNTNVDLNILKDHVSAFLY
jgi:hypothetical protein